MSIGLKDLKKRPIATPVRPEVSAPEHIPVSATVTEKRIRPWEDAAEEEFATRTGRAQLAVQKAQRIAAKNESMAREFSERSQVESVVAGQIPESYRRRPSFLDQLKEFFMDM